MSIFPVRSQTQKLCTGFLKQDGAEVQIPLTSICSFQVSKEGSSKKAMLRLVVSDRSDKPTLDFGKSFSDRDAVRDMLNRLQSPVPQSQAKEGSGSATTAASVVPARELSEEERSRRVALLQRKEVFRLHKAVVSSGAVTDDMFWAAMRYRYKENGEPRARSGLAVDDEDDGEAMDIDATGEGANGDSNAQNVGSIASAAAAARRKGVPSDAFVASKGSIEGPNGLAVEVDLSTWTSVIPNAGQRHMVFMAKPAVGRAYRETVGKGKMSEERFWQLFSASSWSKRRAGRMTKTDTARTAEADTIFAPFESAERRLADNEATERARHVARELDLAHRDDHRGVHVHDLRNGEGTSVVVGTTARSGLDCSSGLRLVRLVNRHGSLVLDEGGVGAWEAEGVDKERPLEDLVTEQSRAVTSLELHNSDARVAKQNSATADRVIDVEACADVRNWFDGWEADVTRFRKPVPAGEARLTELLMSMRP